VSGEEAFAVDFLGGRAANRAVIDANRLEWFGGTCCFDSRFGVFI